MSETCKWEKRIIGNGASAKSYQQYILIDEEQEALESVRIEIGDYFHDQKKAADVQRLKDITAAETDSLTTFEICMIVVLLLVLREYFSLSS